MTATTDTQGANTSLTFGVKIGATDGFDSGTDVPHPPQGPDATFDAYFPLDHPLFSQLDKDFRGEATTIQWILRVTSSKERVTLAWDASSVPAGLSLMLTGTGSTADMKAVSSIVLGTGTHLLTITATPAAANPYPILTNGAITPPSGYEVDSFTYSVTYTDADNQPPVSVTVSIDGGAPRIMAIKAGGDSSFTNGEVYQYTAAGTQLGQGSHTFQFAASDGTNNATGDTASHTGPVVSSTPIVGDGGTETPSTSTPANTDASDILSDQGVFTRNFNSTSVDGKCMLTIAKGTRISTQDGKPLTQIPTVEPTTPPSLPVGSSIVGLVYMFSPDDATFEPSVEITVAYDLNSVPEGASEADLVMAAWDKVAQAWIILDGCTVNLQGHIVTVSLQRLGVFAIISKAAESPETTKFGLGSLTIAPARVVVGEIVTVSVLVVNLGPETGNYTVKLKINDVLAQAQQVNAASGASQTVTFTVTESTPGTYEVEIGGQTGRFEILTPPAPTNWPLIVGTITGVLVVGVVVFLIIRRRRAPVA